MPVYRFPRNQHASLPFLRYQLASLPVLRYQLASFPFFPVYRFSCYQLASNYRFPDDQLCSLPSLSVL